MKYNNIRKKVGKFQSGGAIGTLAEVIGGFIPGVSEAIDIMGIARGIITGNPIDAVLSAAGLIIPGTNGAALKTVKGITGKPAKQLKEIGEKILNHSKEVDELASLSKIEKRTSEQSLKMLELRKTILGNDNIGGKVGADTFRELKIDTRNLAEPQQGFKLNERGVLVNSDGRPALVDPDYRGYDTDTILEQIKRASLRDDPEAQIHLLDYLNSRKNPHAQRHVKGMEEVRQLIESGRLGDLPRFNYSYGRVPQVNHVVTAQTSNKAKGTIFGSGWHAEHPWNPQIDSRVSGSGNMYFTGDSVESVITYGSTNRSKMSKLIDEMPNGNAKTQAEQAFQITDLFEKLYIGDNVSKTSKLPAKAYTDPQFKDYVNARRTLAIIGGNDPTMGKLAPVVYQSPKANEVLIIKGAVDSNGDYISVHNDLNGAQLSLGPVPFKTNQKVDRLEIDTIGGKPSIDQLISKDAQIKGQRADNVYNRGLMQTYGDKRKGIEGLKLGGTLK